MPHHISLPFGHTPIETVAETTAFINKQANTNLTAIFLGFLSNINGIKASLNTLGQYLFPIAFGLKAFDWLIYTWRYVNASNKNVSKAQQLVLKTLTTIGMGLAIFGASLITAAAVPVLFSSLVAVEAAVSFSKTVYFSIRTYQARTFEEKQFFLKKTKQHGLNAGIEILTLNALVITLIVAPYITSGIIATTAILTGATLMITSVLSCIQRYRTWRLQQSRLHVSNTAPLHMPTAPTPFRLASKYQFFTNSINVLYPISSSIKTELHHIKTMINHHITTLVEKNPPLPSFIETYLWSECSKRENKIAALKLLQAFIEQFEAIHHTGEVSVNRILFKYKNNDDLINQFDRYITQHYPRAYQSFFKEVGNTQALFKRAYHILHVIHHAGSSATPPTLTSPSSSRF